MFMVTAIAVKVRLRTRILKPLVRKKNIAENAEIDDAPSGTAPGEEKRDETTEAIRDQVPITSIRALLSTTKGNSTEVGANVIRDIEGEAAAEVKEETAFKRITCIIHIVYIFRAAASASQY